MKYYDKFVSFVSVKQSIFHRICELIVIAVSFILCVLTFPISAWKSFKVCQTVFCLELSWSMHEILSWSKECPSLKIGSVSMMSKSFKSFRDSTEANM